MYPVRSSGEIILAVWRSAQYNVVSSWLTAVLFITRRKVKKQSFNPIITVRKGTLIQESYESFGVTL